MSNGITISKEAFVKAGGKDKNDKRDAQREMLFDGILHLDKKIDDFTEIMVTQKALCKKEFASKYDVKWLTWGFRTLALLIMTGLIALIFNLAKDAIAK